MDCKHQYFLHNEEGKLACSVCGKTVEEIRNPAIEDKADKKVENKQKKSRRSGR